MTKTSKKYKVPALQHYTHTDLLFLFDESTTFISKNQNPHTPQTNSQTASCVQVTSSKVLANVNPETEPTKNDQYTELQEIINLIKQIERLTEACRSKTSAFSENQILKKVPEVHHAAKFSCANLQLSFKTMQHSSNEVQSVVTIIRKVFTINLFSKMK